MSYTEKDEIIRDALTAGLSKMAACQIHENNVSPRVFVRALLTVAANISDQHLNVKISAALFRDLADGLEENWKKHLN